MSESEAGGWPEDIFRELTEAGVRQAAYVPDAGHTQLIDRCRAEAGIDAVTLTTEEEGVAMLAGAWLGGQRGVLLMQSSGVGNCVNMLSLTRTCRFPLLMLVTMRGTFGEYNPWQTPMGQATAGVLRLADVMVFEAEHPADVGDTVAAAARMAFEGPAATAVLLSQRLIGAKSFGRQDLRQIGGTP